MRRLFLPTLLTMHRSEVHVKTNKKQPLILKAGCFSTHGAKSDCSHITYGIKDIPAFIEEDHMTSPKNFISAMSFEMVEWVNPYNGSKTMVTKEWKDIDYQLKTLKTKVSAQLKREGFI